jgi:hypothetical protein
MAADAQLSPDFWLHEWPCYELMTADQVAGALEATAAHLQPLRDRFGRIKVTSGHFWRFGCIPRAGAHAVPGTVDYVPLDAPLRDVFDYAVANLRPTFGTLIFERDHIHRTAPGTQGRIGWAFTEPTEGSYARLELPPLPEGSAGALALLGAVGLVWWLSNGGGRRSRALA